MAEVGAKQKWVAVVLAAVAAVLSGIALAVVLARGRGATSRPAQATPSGPRVVDHEVVRADLVALDAPDVLAPTGGGLAIRDAAVADRLGLAPGDLITAVQGQATSTPYQLADTLVVALQVNGVRTIYVELASGTLVRWRIQEQAGYVWHPPRPTAVDPFASSPPVPTAPDPAIAAIHHVDDTHVVVPRATVDALLANPMAMAHGARVVPEIKNGRPAGFKLYAIRPGDLFAALGFANGDTVRAINGLQLTSADDALRAYTSLRSASHLEVAIDRRGQPLSIEIEIK